MMIKKIEHFFATHTVWVFLTVLLFVSLMRVKEIHPPTFSNYYLKFFIYCFLFFPVLLFSSFRNFLKKNYKSRVVRLLWSMSFVLYPFLLNFMPVEEYLGFNWNGMFVSVIAIFLLFSELAIQSNDFFRKHIFSKKWLEKLGLEKIILLFVFLLSMLLVLLNSTFQENYLPLSWLQLTVYFISFTLQFFLTLSCYYFFYYVNHYFLVPQFLKKRGIVYYAFSSAATLLLFYPIIAEIIMSIPALTTLNVDFVSQRNIFYEDMHIVLPMSIMFISIPFILAIEWFQSSSKIATLEKEKSNTELSLLKQQINPHFFFNTLNNLYALSLTKDKQTPEVILQLSELMRYVIYKGKQDSVLLKEEVKYIEDYIQLQQIRLHKQLDFKFSKNIKNDRIQIPPLLFITFVENAFKHGVEPSENACFLHLDLESDEHGLRFSCKNSMEEKNTAPAGIGLSNLRRRLALRFPTQHNIQIKEEKNVFEAQLFVENNKS